MLGKKVAVWTALGVLGIAVVTALMVYKQRWRPRSITLQGAVIRRDDDTRKQLPIADVTVAASDGAAYVSTQSDASGYFSLTFRESVWPGQSVNLTFRHPNYQPFDLPLKIGLRSTSQMLYVASLTHIPVPVSTDSRRPPSVVSNLRVRFSFNFETEEDIGSAVKTFQVVNQGNVPCNRQAPCSPDGNWKAATGSATLDAGVGNEFRNVRASCIAGPCPFTRIDSSGFERGGRTIVAWAEDWSGTATFLLEAEAIHTTIGSRVRESYPVVYGRVLNFTLPPTQEGVSIEAEIDGAPMVFPLGPNLYLSWATCIARTNREAQKSTVYRCELKPGYRF
jgi:hypothetical protein